MSNLRCTACGSPVLWRQDDGRYRCLRCAATMTVLKATRVPSRRGSRWVPVLVWLALVAILIAAAWQVVAP